MQKKKSKIPTPLPSPPVKEQMLHWKLKNGKPSLYQMRIMENTGYIPKIKSRSWKDLLFCIFKENFLNLWFKANSEITQLFLNKAIWKFLRMDHLTWGHSTKISTLQIMVNCCMTMEIGTLATLTSGYLMVKDNSQRNTVNLLVSSKKVKKPRE